MADYNKSGLGKFFLYVKDGESGRAEKLFSPPSEIRCDASSPFCPIPIIRKSGNDGFVSLKLHGISLTFMPSDSDDPTTHTGANQW